MKYILIISLVLCTTFCKGQTADEIHRFLEYWKPINSTTDSVTYIKDTARYYTHIKDSSFVYHIKVFNVSLSNYETAIDSIQIWPTLSVDSLKISSHYKNYNNNLVDSVWMNKDTTSIIFRYYKRK